MKASRMIELLQKTIENHGNLDVVTYDRCNENDGFIHKITVQKSDDNGEMDYYCAGDSVINTPLKEYVVLFNN